MEQCWRAIYKDGTFLNQGKNQYENIDRTKLAAFEIYEPDGDVASFDGELKPIDRSIYKLNLEEGQRLICRRLGIKRVNAVTGKETQADDHVFMVGWQQNVNGKNVQSITYILPDGRIEQSGKWIGKDPNLRPEEQ